MKAWEELESDPNVSLWWYGDERAPTQYYYIDHGVRISKDIESGRIDVKNAQMSDEHYINVTDDQYNTFAELGWLAGCYEVCIDVCINRLDKVNYLISIEKHEVRMDELMERKGKLSTKLQRYLELNERLNIFAPTKK
jgi:hypothetical protein